MLWIPRIALSPLYVANEYVLRRPLGALVTHAERDRWSGSAARVLSFGERRRNLILPTAALDIGLLPSVGVYFSRDDVVATDNTLELAVATGGPRSFRVALADRYALGSADRVSTRFDLERARDHLFVGIGPDAESDTKARYGLSRIAAGIEYRRWLASASWVEVVSGIQRTRFLEGDCCDDPSLDARIASGEVMAPPGHRAPYTAVHGRAGLILDSRRPRPEPDGGAYLHLQVAPSLDVHDGRAWLRYGGAVGGAIDLTGHRRTLAMELALDFVDAMTSDPIPFPEYATLGGEQMSGFVTGWMIGRSTATAQLGYRWPVWLGLDARTRLAVGNAFGSHLEGLSPGKLRLSGDLGLTTSTDPDRGFEVLFGIGSETFEQGAAIASVRVLLALKRAL